jgi:hypothetical protein
MTMSHDETSGTVTRKERRAAYSGTMLGRKPASRHVFNAEAYVRKDWTPTDVTEHLEDRARGYNGILRQLLCTAAAMLKDAVSEDLLKTAAEKELVETLAAKYGGRDKPEVMAPIAPLNLSKRNQQPGRLSGGEREALRKFITLVASAEGTDREWAAEGRALLTKVRKRALGGEVAETVDCSALMPVGVEEGGS